MSSTSKPASAVCVWISSPSRVLTGVACIWKRTLMGVLTLDCATSALAASMSRVEQVGASKYGLAGVIGPQPGSWRPV